MASQRPLALIPCARRWNRWKILGHFCAAGRFAFAVRFVVYKPLSPTEYTECRAVSIHPVLHCSSPSVRPRLNAHVTRSPAIIQGFKDQPGGQLSSNMWVQEEKLGKGQLACHARLGHE